MCACERVCSRVYVCAGGRADGSSGRRPPLKYSVLDGADWLAADRLHGRQRSTRKSALHAVYTWCNAASAKTHDLHVLTSAHCPYATATLKPPVGLAGRRSSTSQLGPVHAISHSHLPSVHTPACEQSAVVPQAAPPLVPVGVRTGASTACLAAILSLT